MAQELKDKTIQKDEIFISHDVVSLFTKMPITVTVHIEHDRLKKDRTLQKRTSLTAEDITRLLDFVSTSTYFQYRGSIYRQKEGFAMGYPLSAIMSGFFMEDLEAWALSTAPGHCGLSLWKRYVGDILEIIKIGHSQELTDHLNTLDKTNNINFAHEETDKTIHFLDLDIKPLEDGSIKTHIYQKPTRTDQYLLWTSEHPTS